MLVKILQRYYSWRDLQITVTRRPIKTDHAPLSSARGDETDHFDSPVVAEADHFISLGQQPKPANTDHFHPPGAPETSRNQQLSFAQGGQKGPIVSAWAAGTS